MPVKSSGGGTSGTGTVTKPIGRKKRSRTAGSDALIPSSEPAFAHLDQCVENPILTSVQSRLSFSKINLLLNVKTKYKSIAGARRQIIHSYRYMKTLNFRECENFQSWQEDEEPEKETTNENGDGAPTQKINSCAVPAIDRIQWMVVPEFLSEELWERHGYSLNDIRKTLDVHSDRMIWQMVLSYNRTATNASSNVCSDTELDLSCGGRTTAIQKLLNILREVHTAWVNRPSITWNLSQQINGHSPALPVHRVERTHFEYMAGQVAHETIVPLNRETSTSVVKKAQHIFAWRNIMIVPLDLNENQTLLLVSRVIPWRVYIRSYGMPKILREYPNCIWSDGEHYAVMSESFYFYSGLETIHDPNLVVTHDVPHDVPVSVQANTDSTSTSPRLFKKLKL